MAVQNQGYRSVPSRRLFESFSDLIYAGLGANFVAIDAGRAADADAANNLIANLDTKTAIDERNVRQFGQAPDVAGAPEGIRI